MTAPFDSQKVSNELGDKFIEVARDAPSKLVACVHLGSAARIFKAMAHVGLIDISEMVDYFAMALDIAASAPDPGAAPPEVQYQNEDGTIVRTTGRKH